MSENMKTISVLVEVTTEDIENGTRMDCQRCPVALAITRLVKEDYYPQVSGRCVSILHSYTESGLDTTLWENVGVTCLPPETQRFVRRYDDGKTPEPISFQLEIPEVALS